MSGDSNSSFLPPEYTPLFTKETLDDEITLFSEDFPKQELQYEINRDYFITLFSGYRFTYRHIILTDIKSCMEFLNRRYKIDENTLFFNLEFNSHIVLLIIQSLFLTFIEIPEAADEIIDKINKYIAFFPKRFTCFYQEPNTKIIINPPQIYDSIFLSLDPLKLFLRQKPFRSFMVQNQNKLGLVPSIIFSNGQIFTKTISNALITVFSRISKFFSLNISVL